MGKARRIPRKARNVPVTVRSVPWDMGASGPANQIGLIDQERGEVDLATGKVINPNRVFGKARMPVWQRYVIQGRLTRAHAAAAERLYEAWLGISGKDPLAALSDKVQGSSGSDPNVLAFDRKREFYRLKASIPTECWPVMEAVILRQDIDLEGPFGKIMHKQIDAYARLRVGLDAVMEA
jgi:hypothetical protein